MTGLLLFRRQPILCKGEVRMKTQKKTYILALAPFLLLCILFEIIPVIYTVVRSFFPEEETWDLHWIIILIFLLESCTSKLSSTV